MQMQVEAERKKRATVLESEGKFGNILLPTFSYKICYNG